MQADISQQSHMSSRVAQQQGPPNLSKTGWLLAWGRLFAAVTLSVTPFVGRMGSADDDVRGCTLLNKLNNSRAYDSDSEGRAERQSQGRAPHPCSPVKSDSSLLPNPSFPFPILPKIFSPVPAFYRTPYFGIIQRWAQSVSGFIFLLVKLLRGV